MSLFEDPKGVWKRGRGCLSYGHGSSLEEILEEAYGQNALSIKRYADILASRGVERGVLGPREADKIFDRHILNCQVLVQAIQDAHPRANESLSIVDIGSGAGLPGIVLAIAMTNATVTLVESLQRRTVFLDEVVEELGLGDRVTVVRSRAEDLREQTFDVVTARAVANLATLLKWTHHLVKPDGCFVFLKGDRVDTELEIASGTLKKYGLTASKTKLSPYSDKHATNVVTVKSI